MGADLEVEVLYRGGNPYCEPKARASPRGGVWRKPECETHDRKNMKRIGGALVRVSWPHTAKPVVAKGRGRRCDRCGGIVSVLTRGDLPAGSGEPTGEAERPVLGGQESAEAIVPAGESVGGEGPNVEWRGLLEEIG
jgi:hypothetical protein